jgi:hypothetical protein
MLTEILYKTRNAKIGVISLDASVREQHDHAATITTHPVESGSDITDHARKEPREIAIEGVITDTPLTYGGGCTADSREPARSAYEQLRDYVEQGGLVEIYTTLATYPSMKLIRLQVTRDAAKGNSLHFSATAKEIVIATSRSVALPEPTVDRGKPPTQKGKQPATEQPTSRSFAKNIWSSLRGAR